jgi:hypothetical protein
VTSKKSAIEVQSNHVKSLLLTRAFVDVFGRLDDLPFVSRTQNVVSACNEMVSSAKDVKQARLFFIPGCMASAQQDKMKEHAKKNGFVIVDKPSK